MSKRLMRILNMHVIQVYFKSSNRQRYKLVHLRDKLQREKRSNVVHDIQCTQESNDLNIGEINPPSSQKDETAQKIYNIRSGLSSFPAPKGQRTLLWIQWSAHSGDALSGVKEAVCQNGETFLHRGEGLRHFLFLLYNPVWPTRASFTPTAHGQ